MAKTYKQNPIRELRPSQSPKQMQMPILHQIVVGALIEACIAERVGVYIGKISSTGGLPISLYMDDETLKDYISSHDEPIEWVQRVCDVAFGAQILREVLETIKRRTTVRPSERSKTPEGT